MSFDYKSTVYLPKTGFPMKAGLPKREPELLQHWEETEWFRHHRDVAEGREKFILHDGPPYANGHLHIGHALNKILKDVIVRSQQMLGKDSHYVPGWDCHGLPIEWKIEEKYRKKKKNKDDVPIVQFRHECREFAEEWIDIQRDEFKRLGIIGEWENPYTTMSFAAEARIAGELGKFLMDGSLYRGAKPVMWSPVEKTALAEAEIEYFDHTSTTIYVAFPVASTVLAGIKDASIVIWTTTPWTMPGNRAVAYGNDIDYVLVEVTAVADDSPAGLNHLAQHQLGVADDGQVYVVVLVDVGRVVGGLNHGLAGGHVHAHAVLGEASDDSENEVGPEDEVERVSRHGWAGAAQGQWMELGEGALAQQGAANGGLE